MPGLAAFRTLAATLPPLARAVVSSEGRAMLAEVRRVQRSLPERYQALSLPDFLAELTPATPDWQQRNQEQVRALVDALAFWDRRSPFGICLRRSLLRYHFLRRTGLPLGIVLAVRIRHSPEQPGLAGHAWNLLHGQPYYERPENIKGFTEIYRWPEEKHHG